MGCMTTDNLQETMQMTDAGTPAPTETSDPSRASPASRDAMFQRLLEPSAIKDGELLALFAEFLVSRSVLDA